MNGHGPQIDYNSNDWRTITGVLLEMKADYINMVMSTGISEREADYYRGRASAIELMLDWDPHAGR